MPLPPTHITGDKKGHNDERTPGSRRQVPRAKKPRTRPPVSLRDKIGFLQANLPTYSGPYGVGMMDIEVPVKNPRSFSHIKRHHHHILKLETVLMSIYYPSQPDAGTGKDPSGRERWSRETWLPRPRIQVASGYGRFAGVGAIAVPWFAATTMFTKVPAYRNAAPARHWPADRNVETAGFEVKDETGSAPDGKPEQPVFPLMVFSHGLGGNRTAYSSLCGEFASYGFVVCAIEHRDGSGPRTYVNRGANEEQRSAKGDGDSSSHNDNHEKDRKGGKKRKKFSRVDYIFPLNNPKDTLPASEQGVDHELRIAQLDLRLAEIEEAYEVLCLINDGQGQDVADANLRIKGKKGASSRGLRGVDWETWKNVFHTDRVTLLGHSFGAATTVAALRNHARCTFATQGIIYDIWGAAVQGTPLDQCHFLESPLLAINSEAFMYWQSNFDTVNSLVQETKNNNAPAWLMTVKGTVHISQCDFSILYPHICSVLLKMTANPQRAVDINVGATLEYLKQVMPDRSAILERTMKDEGFLKINITEETPVEHQPDEKWLAARLKIPHEFRTRLVPKLERRIKRLKEPDAQPEDEVWLHVASNEEDVRGWCQRRDDAEEKDLTEKCRTKQESGSEDQDKDIVLEQPLSHEDE